MKKIALFIGLGALLFIVVFGVSFGSAGGTVNLFAISNNAVSAGRGAAVANQGGGNVTVEQVESYVREYRPSTSTNGVSASGGGLFFLLIAFGLAFLTVVLIVMVIQRMVQGVRD